MILPRHSLFLHHFLMDNFCCFTSMATRFSQDRYTRAKKKNN